MCSLPAGIKGPVKLPHNAQSSHPLPPPTPSLEEEEEEEEEEEKESEEEQSCSFSEEQNEEEVFSSNKRQWMKHEYCRKKSQENTPQSVSVKVCKALPRCEGDSAQTKDSQKEEASCRKTKQYHRGSRAARDSGVAESLEDRDSGFSFTYRLGKSKDTHTLKSYGNIKNVEVTEGAAVLPGPVRYSSHPRGINLVVAAHKVTAAAAPAFKMNREELIEEIQLAREERKQLEWMRQELLRKGKDLLAQNRHRRNQARDSWKKKYFETKKAAAPLENNLRNLRQELEIFYTKLLHQLHARENRGKPKRQSRTSIKNELIIEIMTESHEIDNLKRKIENAKMKLLTEVKLRKQAATELRALKAELAQKKSQLSHPRPGFCLAFGTLTRDKPRAQNTSI